MNFGVDATLLKPNSRLRKVYYKLNFSNEAFKIAVDYTHLYLTVRAAGHVS